MPKLTNEQYYNWFNAKVDIGEDIGITRKYRVLMEDTAQDFFEKFDGII